MGFVSAEGTSIDASASSSYAEPTTDQTQKASIDEFREYLQSKRLAKSSIRAKVRLIKTLQNNVNLWDADSVKQYIHKADWCAKRRNNALYAYRDWCDSKGFEFKFKRYRVPDDPLPYIPSEREIDMMIAGFGRSYSAFLQTLKESAFRPIEAHRLRVMDIDFERKSVTLNEPAKYSRPRQFKMSSRLEAMLRPLCSGKSPSDAVWTTPLKDMGRWFFRERKELSKKLGCPNLMRISFKTFRHWKATITYHQTKDILYVQRMLGHKNIKNTLVYTHLISFDDTEEYVVKVASSIDEFSELLSKGYTYVSDYNESKVLRKRK